MSKKESKLSKRIALVILTLGVVVSVPMSALTNGFSELMEQDEHPEDISYEKCSDVREITEDICSYNHVREGGEIEFEIALPLNDWVDPGISDAFCGGGGFIASTPAGFNTGGIVCAGHGTTGIMWIWMPTGGVASPPPLTSFRRVGYRVNTASPWTPRNNQGGQGGQINTFYRCLRWSINTYTVNFNLNGGTYIGGGALSQRINHGGTATAPVATGGWYRFNGWSRSLTINDDLSHDAIVTITANWVRDVHRVDYTVTIDDFTFTRSGGGELVQGILNGNDTNPPDMDDYSECGRRIWPGWADGGETITGPRNITPNELEDEHIRRHEVVFELYNDGLKGAHAGGGDLVQNIEHTFDAELPYVNDPYGHTFIGWDGDDEHEDIQEATTVLALYEPDPFDVVFLNWNGEELHRETVDFGTHAYAPDDPNKYGHTFTGWDCGRDLDNPPSSKSFTVLNAETLYVTAQYTPDPYNVIFKNHDNTVHHQALTYFGSTAEVPEDPVKQGYNFSGWSTDDFTISRARDLVVTSSFTIHCTAENCNEENGLCADCGRCADCCNCCAVDGCNNTDLCRNCGKCQECCDCQVGGPGNSRGGRGGIDSMLERGDGFSFPGTSSIIGLPITVSENQPFTEGTSFPTRIIEDRAAPLSIAPIFYFLGMPVYLFAPFGISSWSIVSLLLTFLGILFLAKNLIVPLIRRGKNEPERIETSNKSGIWKMFGTKWLLYVGIVAIVAILLFAITQDVSALIALFNFWTVVHMALFIGQIVLIKIYKADNSSGEDDTDNNNFQKGVA